MGEKVAKGYIHSPIIVNYRNTKYYVSCLCYHTYIVKFKNNLITTQNSGCLWRGRQGEQLGLELDLLLFLKERFLAIIAKF